jgi:glycogen debranching enzyme
MFENSKKRLSNSCNEKWLELLTATLDLCERSIRQPNEAIEHNFPYPWLEIGPGYAYGPAFGHWDIVHATFNLLKDDPEEVIKQLENNFSLLCDDGRLIGAIFFRGNLKHCSDIVTHPPLWVFLADELYNLHGNKDFLRKCFVVIEKQIGWFERERKTEKGGFYYHDVFAQRKWECGVDESIRFKDIKPCVKACIDASSHVYALYDCAYRWSIVLSAEQKEYKEKRDKLGEFIRTELYNKDTGWFYDEFSTESERKTIEAIDGAWPLVAGVCNQEMAKRIVNNLMSKKLFFAEHPLSMVAPSSPRFKLQMWQGCSWNSFSFWFAYGMFKNGFYAECKELTEKILDATDKIYKSTGKIWEFYHPFGGSPLELARKPQNAQNTPCFDYVGHSPLVAIFNLYQECCKRIG